MKTRLILVALLSSVLTCGVSAQVPATKAPGGKAVEKSPADLEIDAFYKIYNEKDAKVSQERFKAVIDPAIAFLTKNPTHGRANAMLKDLANFAKTYTDPKLKPYRASYTAMLKYEITNQRYKDGVSDDAKAALAALEAATVDFETRDSITKENLNNLREKIDALAEMPGGGRFLKDREQSYCEIIAVATPGAHEPHLKKLLAHKEKSVADMARYELNFVEIKKVPVDLKFTAIDGKPVDLATLRGKVVALVIWSGTNDGTVKIIDAMMQVQSFNKKNLEVIGVSFDKEADRAKLEKFVKDNKIKWPVHFDGKEAKNEWAGKMNVTKAPAVVMIDKKGMFVRNNQSTGNPAQLEAEIKKLIDAK
jgi:peroxiredoxin